MLTDLHLRDLRSSGLTDETIAASGCYSANAASVGEMLGFRPGPCLVFPYPDTSGGEQVPYIRVKPDIPWSNGDGRPAKYLSARGSGNRLYIPANFPLPALTDPSVPLVFTEGEKKALAGCQEGFPTIALPGVACWVSRNGDGKSHPIADLDRIEWTEREVVIAFDSDAATKDTVRREAQKLGRELQSRGAIVRIAKLPRPTTAENRDHKLSDKFGMDDFLKVRGKAAFEGVLGRAKPISEGSGKKQRTSSADLADRFVRARDLEGRLRWWRSEFYEFKGSRYVLLPEGDLLARVNAWLSEEEETRPLAGTRIANQIVTNLESIGHIAHTLNPPIDLGGNLDLGKDPIMFANGFIRIEELLKARFESLRPYGPDLFNVAALPYVFVEAADCPRWLTFLEDAIPDPEVRDLMQEIFGYCLTRETGLQKFFLFQGEGADGKSVVNTVLRGLVGPDNASSVGLEAFDPSRTFALAAMDGKLVNIVEDMGEIDRPAEGLLKQLVSGGSITVERKHRDPYTMTPTAKFVFATNVLPRFADKSDGLWRRMIVVQFRHQVLEESDQDKSLVDPNFWRESGELPGVFLWALGGLARLKERGHFLDPASCRQAKAEYRRESNPAGTFLEERCNVGTSFSVDSGRLYEAYRSWTEDNGYRPLSAQYFAKEVRRYSPTAELSKHPQTVGARRARVWTGVDLAI